MFTPVNWPAGNRHGFLRGYEKDHLKQRAVRARRGFCSNRNQAAGCGRTFSDWTADKVQRLFLSAGQLCAFLKEVATTGNKRQGFGKLQSSMSDSAFYRIWKRFQTAQASVRTAVSTICLPPKLDGTHPGDSPAQSTLAHLDNTTRR